MKVKDLLDVTVEGTSVAMHKTGEYFIYPTPIDVADEYLEKDVSAVSVSGRNVLVIQTMKEEEDA